MQRAGRYADALAAYRSLPLDAVTLGVVVDLGVCFTRLGELDEAQGWLGRADAKRPDDPQIRTALLELGAAMLAQGRYAEGWPLIENRVGLRPDLVPLINPPYPQWRGEALDGKSILVWVEQGLGDQIQFARFANDLADLGARVTLACNPILAGVFDTLRGVDKVMPVPIGGGAHVPRHDFWTRYFSLPGLLGVTLETLQSRPYLLAPHDRAPIDIGQARRGLFWRTSPTGATASAKTLPEPLARELLDLGCISLHPEDTGAKDFADTAAIVQRLELVITADTGVAHLAGAMGKPVWILLPHAADWRWLKGRDDSPWYASVRLFRQPAPGDWASVVARVKAELQP